MFSLRQPESLLGRPDFRLQLFGLAGIDRPPPRLLSKSPQLMKQVNPVSAPRFLEESGGNLSSWLMMMQTRPEAFARIVSAVKDVLPDVANIMIWPTAQSTVFIASAERSLRTPVPVWQMSDGELVFLALLSLIFSPEEFRAPLFCVEELENHLHPRLIDALVKLHDQRRQELNGNAGQVIVTTHSPQVVDKVGLDELIVVSKRNGESVFTRPGDKLQLRKLLEDGEIGLGDLVYSGALGEE
jgi:predicted ATPase